MNDHRSIVLRELANAICSAAGEHWELLESDLRRLLRILEERRHRIAEGAPR